MVFLYMSPVRSPLVPMILQYREAPSLVEAAHGEVYGASVGVFDVGHLMVHHVVVTVVDTAAVRACLYGIIDRLRSRLEANTSTGHSVWPQAMPVFSFVT